MLILIIQLLRLSTTQLSLHALASTFLLMPVDLGIHRGTHLFALKVQRFWMARDSSGAAQINKIGMRNSCFLRSLVIKETLDSLLGLLVPLVYASRKLRRQK